MIDYSNILLSESDLIIKQWGYNLLDECQQMISIAEFTNGKILDVATGTGRAVALLSRISSKVITGDLNFNLKSESDNRISEEYLSNVSYIRLNMEGMPFKEGAIENIVCINTMHELQNPVDALKELIRIHSGKGKILVADFNSKGFDVFDEVHMMRFGKLHTRGVIELETVRNILEENYIWVNQINTTLNKAFIAFGKKHEE